MECMNRNRDKRPKTFEDKLRDFMKESDAKQKDIIRRNNKNAHRKRKELSAHRLEET